MARKPKRSFEEMLGAKWLPLLGIAAVVIGVGFLVGSKWTAFPNWLRVLILYAGGLALLAGGIFLERKGRYRVLGRSLIGGGWAVIALVTYAIANVRPLLVLPSQNIDLFLLLAVIGAMVWHTLKYKSQLVTGAGFLLGFVAIGMNPNPPYNLIAAAILITGMTVIVVRRQWFQLEVFGILASYVNHAIWLYGVYEQQGQPATFEYHSASVALVIGYWVIFRVSYLLRKVSNTQQESISTAAGLLNPIGFLLVMKYQGFHPEWAWKVLLVMGAVEFILGQLPVSRRRLAPFQVLSSLGAALMVAAPLLKYSGNQLDVIWLAGGEAFLLAGIFTRERLFRGFGLIISFLVALHAVPLRIFPLAQQVASSQPHHDGQISLVLLLIAVVLYANAHVTRRLWPDLFADELESQTLSVLSFVASLFAVAAAYAYVPDHAVAVVMALFVAWLSGTGKLFSISEMVYEAHWVAGVALVQVIANDSSLETNWQHVPQRVLAFASVAALFYLSSRFVRLSDTAGKAVFFAAYAWAATSLLTLLIWFQFQATAGWAVAVLWIALALALSVAAQALKRTDFRWQAFVLVLLSAIRTLLFNFDLTQTFHSITYRLLSVSVIALGIYLLARWAPLEQIRPVYTVIGTLLLALLAYKETAAPWTAVAWISLAFVLCLAARWWKDRPLLWQTHFLSALALGWTVYTNFDPQYRHSKLQLLTVGIVAALFYVLNWATDIAGVIADSRISYAYAWAGSLLLSWLAWYQLDPNSVSFVWGVFALVLFEFPELAKSLKIDATRAAPSWRAQAYVALAGSFAHIFYSNFNVSGWGPAAYAVLPLPPIYFYVYWAVAKREVPRMERSIRIEYLMAFLGTATLAALARFELQADAVAIGYAGLVVGTLLVAWLAQRQIFLFQALVMLGVTAFRISMTNFYHLHDAFSSSLSSSIWAIALLACAVPLAFQVRKNGQETGAPRWLNALALHPEQLTFFVPVVLLAVLLFIKLSGLRLTFAWAVEGFAVFALALWAKERSFRLTGLGLLMLSVAKLVYDTWYFNDPVWRYSAWIGIGILILVVSFLYGKNREALREYL
jgi:hypothetical protein